jgi:hypothetical protein
MITAVVTMAIADTIRTAVAANPFYFIRWKATAFQVVIPRPLVPAIKLSKGQISIPGVFDPSKVSPPIVEPEPMPLKRVRPAVKLQQDALIEVPDLYSLYLNEAYNKMMERSFDAGVRLCRISR